LSRAISFLAVPPGYCSVLIHPFPTFRRLYYLFHSFLAAEPSPGMEFEKTVSHVAYETDSPTSEIADQFGSDGLDKIQMHRMQRSTDDPSPLWLTCALMVLP